MFQSLAYRNNNKKKTQISISLKKDFCVMGNFLAGRMWALNLKTLMAQDFWNFIFMGHDLIATGDLNLYF